jgi:hypothetical protein
MASASGAELTAHPRTEREFVSAFVAAVNANDMIRLRKIVHPKCLDRITRKNKSFYDQTLGRDLRRTIPSNYKAVTTPVAADEPLPFEGMMIYPIRPTNTVQIDFEKSANSVITLIRQVVVEDGNWWFVIPSPTAETMAKMREMKSRIHPPSQDTN